MGTSKRPPIREIRLENFQAHEDLTVKFGKITTIIGPSDSGKTSIIRALKWMLTNKPGGHGFIRDGSHTAKITLKVDERVMVRERRGTSKNKYHMDDQEYVAFGNEVPEPMAKVFNVNELNFQEQHDAPFWFTTSAGELSKRLNQIVDLSLIDSALSNVDSISRKTSTEVRLLEERKSELKIKKADLKWTKEATSDLEAIEKIASRVAGYAQRGSSLKEAISAIETHDKRYKQDRTTLHLGSEALLFGGCWSNDQSNLTLLEDRIEIIEQLETEINQPLPASTKPLEELVVIIERLQTKKQSLDEAIENIEGIETWDESELTKLEAKLKKAMGKNCPLCLQKIK